MPSGVGGGIDPGSQVQPPGNSLWGFVQGAWRATSLAAIGALVGGFGGNVLAKPTIGVGSLIYGGVANAVSELTIGAANTVLTSSGSAPQWSNSLNLGGATNSTTSLTGTLLVGNGIAATNVGIGAGNIMAGASITAGTTLTSVGNTTIGGNIQINNSAATSADVQWQRSGVVRWLWRMNSDAESGSDAGSTMFLNARADAGGSIDNPITFVRAAGGLITLTRPISLTSTTEASAIGTAAYSCSGGGTFAKSLGLGSIAAPGTLFLGQMWMDSTRQTLMNMVGASTANALKVASPGVVFTATADATVANNGAETSIFGTGIGTKTLPANFLVAGKTVRITVRGIFSNLGAATQRIKVKYGSTVLLDTTAVAVVGTLTNAYFEVSALVTCRTVGGTGTVSVSGQFSYDNGTTVQADAMSNTTTVTLDTTTANALDVTETWGAASASNTITGQQVLIETLN